MSARDTIQSHITASIEAKRSLDLDAIEAAAKAITQAYRDDKKWILAGNGGSAADAQHLAAEMVGRFVMERRGLPAIALTTNSSSVTAIGNDYGYDAVFERQIEAFGNQGDVFMGISTSGNSENIIRALKKATDLGLTTIGMTGKDGGRMKDIVDIHINVAAPHTARIQEAHILVGHILCDLVETRLFG